MYNASDERTVLLLWDGGDAYTDGGLMAVRFGTAWAVDISKSEA